jgi:hypothetical protein
MHPCTGNFHTEKIISYTVIKTHVCYITISSSTALLSTVEKIIPVITMCSETLLVRTVRAPRSLLITEDGT